MDNPGYLYMIIAGSIVLVPFLVAIGYAWGKGNSKTAVSLILVVSCILSLGVVFPGGMWAEKHNRYAESRSLFKAHFQGELLDVKKRPDTWQYQWIDEDGKKQQVLISKGNPDVIWELNWRGH